MLRSLRGRHGPSLSQSSLELHLSPSSTSAANSSITGGSGSASGVSADDGQERSYCPGHLLGNAASDHDDDDADADNIGFVENGFVENDGQGSVNSADFRASPIGASIPHLLSTASDDDDDGVSYLLEEEYANPYYERDDTHLVNRGGNRKRHLSADVDRFETMLLQQQQAANNCLDDSVASIVHVGDDNTSSGNSSQYPVQAATKATSSTEEEQESTTLRSVEDKTRWSEAGRQIRSKLSLSNRSDGATATAAQPIIMLVDLDDNDAALPWMLSQPELERTKIFTNNAAVSSRTLIAPLPLRDEDTLPPHPPPSTNTLPSSRRTNSGGAAASASTSQSVPAHRRRTSSFSSVSSQSSFRSILRNGNNMSRTSDVCETASKAGQPTRTPLMPRSGNRYESPAGAKRSHRIVSEKENPGDVLRYRGRSLDAADRPGRARRSVSHSEGKRRHDRGARNANGSQALASDIRDAKSDHRRTVSFPAELIYKERTSQSSQYHRSQSSPVAAPPPRKYSDDLCLTPLLDMGSGRSRKKAPSHIGNAAEISPRTADFLAGNSPAVAAICEAQERKKYGNSYSHYPSSITRPRSGISKGGSNYHGVISGDSGKNTCQPAYQQQPQQQREASFSIESLSREVSTRETLNVGMVSGFAGLV